MSRPCWCCMDTGEAGARLTSPLLQSILFSKTKLKKRHTLLERPMLWSFKLLCCSCFRWFCASWEKSKHWVLLDRAAPVYWRGLASPLFDGMLPALGRRRGKANQQFLIFWFLSFLGFLSSVLQDARVLAQARDHRGVRVACPCFSQEYWVLGMFRIVSCGLLEFSWATTFSRWLLVTRVPLRGDFAAFPTVREIAEAVAAKLERQGFVSTSKHCWPLTNFLHSEKHLKRFFFEAPTQESRKSNSNKPQTLGRNQWISFLLRQPLDILAHSFGTAVASALIQKLEAQLCGCALWVGRQTFVYVCFRLNLACFCMSEIRIRFLEVVLVQLRSADVLGPPGRSRQECRGATCSAHGSDVFHSRPRGRWEDLLFSI